MLRVLYSIISSFFILTLQRFASTSHSFKLCRHAHSPELPERTHKKNTCRRNRFSSIFQLVKITAISLSTPATITSAPIASMNKHFVKHSLPVQTSGLIEILLHILVWIRVRSKVDFFSTTGCLYWLVISLSNYGSASTKSSGLQDETL